MYKRQVWSQRFAKDLEVFTATFVSCDIGHRKPERVAFDCVAEMIGVPPSRILFFDDLTENVAGALDAGLQAVHVSTTSSVSVSYTHLSQLAAAASARLDLPLSMGTTVRHGCPVGRWEDP